MEGFCRLLESIERRLGEKDVNLYRSAVDEQKLSDIIRSEKEEVLFPCLSLLVFTDSVEIALSCC